MSSNDAIQLSGVVITLNEADLMHDTASSLSAAMAKWARYASMRAAALHADGKRSGWSRILFSPTARFLKQYVLKH